MILWRRYGRRKVTGLNPEDRVRNYLRGEKQTTMQLATAADGKPWIATVYFVADNLNLYWLSWPERRHSQELTKRADVAATVVVKTDIPVIGVQLTGVAEEVTDEDTVTRIMTRYVAKYGTGDTFAKHFADGTNHHRLYKLTPREVQLFDEMNYPENSPLSITL